MRLSIQTGACDREIGMKKTASIIKEAGFEAVDWNFDIFTDIDRFREPDYVSILEKPQAEINAFFDDDIKTIREAGLDFAQSHSPFPAYLSGDESTLDRMIPVYEASLRLCAYAGCPATVIHGIAFKRDRGETKEHIDAMNEKLYTSLIPAAKETGVTVLLENLFFSRKGLRFNGHCADPRDAAAFIDHLNSIAGEECFGLCYDTGHGFLTKHDAYDYITTLGSRIKALHIHDNGGLEDDHLAPYAGKFFWDEFIAALRDIRYAGDLNFETFAQYSHGRVPERLIPAWFNYIRAVGEYFRNEIQK